jgi:two-component system, NtrC family, response regulator HydG
LAIVADFLGQLIGECQAIRAVRDEARRLIATERPGTRAPSILIRGSAGTGKSLLAWLIHRSGVRADYPFVTIDCGAVIPDLFDAELFGLAPGHFHDRYAGGKRGLIEAAHNGTLFLDGIDLIPMDSQRRLEDVIERQRTLRLGSTKMREVDVRFISATRAWMLTGGVREPLYRRLAEVTFELPHLSMRGRDVILIAERLLERACRASGLAVKRLAPDAEARLLRSAFFGGVQQLTEAIERITSLTTEPIITAEMLAAVGLPEDRAEG